MENERINNETSDSGKVILTLFGIEKKWVHAPNKGWVDLSQLPVKSSTSLTSIQEEENPIKRAKKSWQFWRK